MNFPTIEALKKYKTHFNADQFIGLDANSAFGNLTVSWMEIVVRIECVNDLIILLYTDFDNLQNQFKNTQTSTLDQLYKQKLYTEQIFYWLRKTADEIISIFTILYHHKKNGVYPAQIKPSSIGEFLNSKAPFDNDLSAHTSTLEMLNEVSNGFKHSFINSQIHNHHGLKYPVVFAYTLKYNKLSNTPRFYTLDLREVLTNYNLFLKDAKEILQKKYGHDGVSSSR